MAEENGDAANIEQLALEFLQGTVPDNEIEEIVEDAEASHASGHAAWQSILDAVPEEYHEALRPQLQEWDAGVSRRFQEIHDEYEPLKAFEGMDPESAQEAMEIYSQLVENPAATWESIGKVFGLSPQETAQAASGISEDFDDDDLPEGLKAKLAQIDKQGEILDFIAQEVVGRKEREEEEEEDDALESYLEDLEEEFGEFDVDYVVSLIASGIDGEEAIGRFQALRGGVGEQEERPTAISRALPKVMSGSGGVPSAAGKSSLTGLSNRDTKGLVEEVLRLNAAN